MSKKNITEKPKNVFLFRCAVSIAIVAGWSALYWTHMSTQEPLYEDTRKYIFENIGTGFLIAYLIIGMFLAWTHQLYWPFLNKVERKQLDERQRDVRERIFEKSYRSLFLILLLSVIIFNSSNNRMETVLWWFGISTFFLLPVMYASWRKDS